MRLDDWQEEVLKYRGDILLCTGRRVGKTQIMAIKAAERMVAKPRTRIVIVSLTEDQAKIIIMMIEDYLKQKYSKLISKGKDKPTQNRINLINKSQALARPVGLTGDSVRGFEGDVLILDEVSRFNELILTAATPILLTTGGEIWACSTPFGKQGWFWNNFNDSYNKHSEDCRFKVFYKSSEEVIKNRPVSESWTELQKEKAIKFLEKEKKDKSNLEYGQEYLGLFLDELRQFFPTELILKCCKNREEIRHYVGENFLGVDVARMGEDETVLASVTRIERKKVCMIGLEISKKSLLTETICRIKNADNKYHFKKIYIDDGGMGVGVFDPLLQDEQTKRKIVAINNSSRSLDNEEKIKKKLLKEDLYNNLLKLMEMGEITLFNDEKLILSLTSMQYEYSEDKLRIFGNYSHITEALVRAAWCMRDKTLNIWIA